MSVMIRKSGQLIKLRLCFAVLLTAVFGIYCKWCMITYSGWNRAHDSHLHVFGFSSPWTEAASAYASDGWLLILSCAPLVLSSSLFRQKFAGWVGMLCLAAVLIQYVQLKSFLNIGQFVTWELHLSALRWGFENPGEVLRYDTLGSLIGLTLLLTFIFILTWIRWEPGKVHALVHFVASKHYRSPLVFTGILLAVPLGFIGHYASGSILSRSFLSQSHAKLFGIGESEVFRRFMDTPLEEVMAIYNQLVHRPQVLASPDFDGKAKGFNLLLVVLETTPAAIFPNAKGDSAFPAFSRLMNHSFVCRNHYSCYPYTNRALFSIFTSMYPYNFRGNFQNKIRVFPLPGLLSSLRVSEYEVQGFFPVRQTFEDDEQLFKSLQMQVQNYPHKAVSIDPHGSHQVWKKLLANDTACLALLLDSLKSHARPSRPFAFAFFPQVSHGPWESPQGDSLAPVMENGRALLRFQDSMLGRILNVLKETGLQESTLVVVTGDHGLRTRKEYPPLMGGIPDSISFKVPLVIHAPQVLGGTHEIDWVTSHIDIAPTLLNLLGIEANRSLEFGTPIWNQELADRTTFFFGHHYLGADAYHRANRFYMWDRIEDRVDSAEHALHFNEAESEGNGERPGTSTPQALASAGQGIRNTIEIMEALQKELLWRLAESSKPNEESAIETPRAPPAFAGADPSSMGRPSGRDLR